MVNIYKNIGFEDHDGLESFKVPIKSATFIECNDEEHSSKR